MFFFNVNNGTEAPFSWSPPVVYFQWEATVRIINKLSITPVHTAYLGHSFWGKSNLTKIILVYTSPAGHGAPKATEHPGGPGIAWGCPWIRSATSPTYRPIHSRYPVFTCYKGVCPVLGGLLQPNRGGVHFSE